MKHLPLILVLIVIACTSRVETPALESQAPVATKPTPVPATPPAPVRTDRARYVLTNGPQGPEATIVSTLHAPAARPLYLLNCNGALSVTLQRKVGEEWVFAWVVAMNACMSPPIVVPAGGEHTASIYLHERSGGVSYPRGAKMLESGTYRVVWTGVLTTFDANAPGWGPELPLEQRVSAPITIEVPAPSAPGS